MSWGRVSLKNLDNVKECEVCLSAQPTTEALQEALEALREIPPGTGMAGVHTTLALWADANVPFLVLD